jgi:hypothetical protein
MKINLVSLNPFDNNDMYLSTPIESAGLGIYQLCHLKNVCCVTLFAFLLLKKI